MIDLKRMVLDFEKLSTELQAHGVIKIAADRAAIKAVLVKNGWSLTEAFAFIDKHMPKEESR